MYPWKTITTKTVLSTPYLSVHKDTVQLPSNLILDDFYAVSLPEAAAVVALDAHNNIILKKEYRYCLKETLIELPAGGFEKNESDGLEVAKRELLEETGYASSNWSYLGATIESPSKCSNHLHLYLAKNCRKVAEQHLDATEDIEVLIVPLNKAVDMVMNGEISVDSSAHGILKIARLLGI